MTTVKAFITESASLEVQINDVELGVGDLWPKAGGPVASLEWLRKLVLPRFISGLFRVIFAVNKENQWQRDMQMRFGVMLCGLPLPVV